MVEFADHIGKSIRLLYYPPYHSKYNPVERCWGILEKHWNGAKLTDTEAMLEWAKSKCQRVRGVDASLCEHAVGDRPSLRNRKGRLQGDGEKSDALSHPSRTVAHQIPDVEKPLADLIAVATPAATIRGDRFDVAHFFESREVAADCRRIQSRDLAHGGGQHRIPGMDSG